MRKSTKGAVAASAAILLLFGGMSTHAAWTANQDIAGTDIGTGHLKLINPTCGGWLLNGSLFDPTSIKIVPGQQITQVCTFTVDLLGASMQANLSVTAPAWATSNGLTGVLQTSATYENNVTRDPITATTALANGTVIKATLAVTLPNTASNTLQDLSATLNSVTVTATQA